jgi:uncharacterized membrane protein YedE/YeeE
MNELALGLITGVIFGFLMQKGGVLRFDSQIGALLFKDMTLVKFMLSAVMVGSVGLQLLADEKVLVFSHKAMNVGAVVAGGLLFGGGWAVAGYCPGTALGALGEGRWTAFFVIAGMLVGAALYAEAFPFLNKTVLLGWKDYGKIGLSQLLGVSPWRCIAVLWGVGVVIFVWCEHKRV